MTSVAETSDLPASARGAREQSRDNYCQRRDPFRKDSILSDLIYKVMTRQEWAKATTAGQFNGSEIDVIDGYIHFSTASQLVETVRKHFHGQTDLVIFSVDPAILGDALRWEPSRGGGLFPHLYGALPVAQISERIELPVDDDGSHRFPPGPWTA